MTPTESQAPTPSGADVNSRAAFEHFMSNAGANPEAIERAFYTYKQAKSANYFHVWSYCWSVREETVAALIARNAEIEAERDEYRKTAAAWCHQAESAENIASALAAENKALREDAERYRWLRYRAGGRKVQWGTEFHFPGIKVLPAGLPDWPAACNVGEYLDAAIDLARTPAKGNAS